MAEEKKDALPTDLTNTLCKYLDKHLALVLYEFILTHKQAHTAYNQQSINNAYLTVLSKTGLVDLYEEQFKAFNPKQTPGDAFKQRKANYIQTMDTLDAQCKPLLEALDSLSASGDFQSLESVPARLEKLSERLPVTPELVDSLFKYAKINFEVGQYDFACLLLQFYRLLSKDEDKKLGALWGELAGEILVGNWDAAYKSIGAIREAIEALVTAEKFSQMQYRTWLAHWSLFVLFAMDNGSLLIDLFFQEKFLNAVQTGSQHLLRYLVAAVVMNRSRKTPTGKAVLTELRRVISAESHNYSDPITDFFKAVYIDHNFDNALDNLRETERVVNSDYFLSRYAEDFRKEASRFYFETYCRVHKMIDIKLIDDILKNGDGERWIVDLIRQARLDAKVDSHAYRVVMGATFPSLYQRVIDKTKMLAYNTSQLVNAVDRKYAGAQESQ
jgi:translation initiation factor 3 subunit E